MKQNSTTPTTPTKLGPQYNLRPWVWWTGIIVILLAGALLRFTGYNFGLPYLENTDESQFLASTLTLRGLYPQPIVDPSYPPGIYAVNWLAQLIVERQTGYSALANPSATTAIVRFASVITDLLNVIVVGLFAQGVGGTIAGWLAALLWLLLPTYLFYSSLGIAEPWLLLCYTLALYWASIALGRNWPGWAILSVLAGLGAFLFKYSAFLAVGPGLVVVLWKLLQNRSERAKWWRVLALQSGSILLCLGLLVVSYDIKRNFEFQPETQHLLSTAGLLHVFDPTSVFPHIIMAFDEFEIAAWWILGVIVLLGTVLYFRQGKFSDPAHRTKLVAWTMIAGFALAEIWLGKGYTLNDYTSLRYILPGTMDLTVLLAASVALIGTFLAKVLRQSWLTPIVPITFAIALIPVASADWGSVRDRALPDTRARLQTWSAQTLDPGSIIVDSANTKTFTREWGGYAGPLRVWIGTAITSHSLEDWIQQDIYYHVISAPDFVRMQQTPKEEAYLEHMLMLKQFPPQNERELWRGPDFYVFRLWRMQHELDVRFGEQIRLTGYDFTAGSLRSGNSITLTLYWQALNRPTDNYNVFIHLVNLDNDIPIAQADGAPTVEGQPTSTWTDSTQTLVSKAFQIDIPENLKSGQYRLLFGLYNYQTGQRLPTTNSDSVALP